MLEIHRFRQVFDAHRESCALRDEHLARRQIVFNTPGVERGGHHDQFQVGPRGLLDLQRPGERDVAVEMPLVKFVEHDRADAAQHRVSNDICRRIPSVTKRIRVFAHARFEPDLVADDLAQRRADLLRHAFREHAGREPARLKDDNLAAITEQAVLEQHLRNLRGFTGAGRRLV